MNSSESKDADRSRWRMVRSIDRRKVLVGVITLAVIASAAVSASGNLTAGSTHTTETDFQNADTLTNLGISGTGENARITTSSEVTSLDSFEDSITDYEGTTSGYSRSTSISRDGSYSLESSSESNLITSSELSARSSNSGNRYSVWVQTSGNNDAGLILGAQNGTLSPGGYSAYVNVGGDSISIRKNPTASSSGTSLEYQEVTLSSDTWYQIVVDWHSDGQINYELKDTSGDSVATISTVDTTYSTGRIGFHNEFDFGVPVYYDDLRGVDAFTDGQYISQTHTVESAEAAKVNISKIGDAEATITAEYNDGESWNSANSTSVTSSGIHQLTLPTVSSDSWRVNVSVTATGDQPEFQLESDSVLFDDNNPEIKSASPSNGELVQESPVELSINVSDADFDTSQGDEVNVTFYDASDDTEIGTDTLTQNRTATASWDSVVGGENDWYAVARDSYGNEVTSQTFTFNAPNELEIRALDSQELITNDSNGDPINVEVQFFGDDGAVAQRNTTDGTVSMTGLPVDQRFSVSVDAGDTYVDRRILITSLIEHQTAYLLNASDTELVQPRFVLEDPTNQFDTEESEIILERPIKTPNGTKFVPVTDDRIGLNGFDTTLEKGQRYRVIVRDPESGSVRRLGEFTPTASEQVTLTVQDVEFDSVSDVDGVDWTARYNTVESGDDEIEFLYRDEQDTTELSYEIYERGNESNVLASGTANGNVTVTESVPPSQSDLVWTVEWTATRANGDTFSASRPVSTSRLPVGPALAPEWQTVVSMLGLIVVAGLFGAASPGVGGIAVASTGGFFFLLGWLPDSTGPLMVLLALFIAVLSYAGRKARGATV